MYHSHHYPSYFVFDCANPLRPAKFTQIHALQTGDKRNSSDEIYITILFAVHNQIYLIESKYSLLFEIHININLEFKRL